MTALDDEGQQTVFEPATSRPPGLASGPAPGGQGSLPPGTLLNHIYEVRRFLARGGMGEVYEGHNVNTDERVAVKVILPHLAADPKMQALFRKEARILTELAHPALVRYRVLAHEPQLALFYIVTEFIDGPSLSDVIGQSIPDPGSLEALARRLAEGLAAAHTLGAIHRDVSPDNVLLPGGRLDQAKIIDFGIARSTELGQQTLVADSFAGKLGYVAPEQFGDFGRNIGPWTDVYSLGLTLLAVATGRAPDLGVTLVEAVERRRKGVDLSVAPRELRSLLQKMLAPDPAHRLQSMGDVIAALTPAPGQTAQPTPTAGSAATAFGRRQPEALGAAAGETSRPPMAAPASRPPAQASTAPMPMARVEAPSRRLWPWFAAGGAMVLAGAALALMLAAHQPSPAARAPIAQRAAAPAPTVSAAPSPSSVPPSSEASAASPTQAAPQSRSVGTKTGKGADRQEPASTAAAKAARLSAAPAAVQPQPVAAPMAPAAPAPPVQEQSQTAATSAAQPDAAVQACWRAGGGRWIYLGYASRPACVAEVFHGSCQTVYGRWGQRELRRYDGKLQILAHGLFSRWSNLGPSDCPTAPQGSGQ